MSTITIRPKDLGRTLRGEAKFVRSSMTKAARAAAMRGVGEMVDRVQKADKVYLGQFSQSWRVTQDPRGIVLYNSAPHAGIVEQGARPHPVSQEGREAIVRWAMRRLSLSEQEAIAAMTRIVAKLRVKGQKGTFLLRSAQPVLTKFYADELTRIIRAGSGKPKPPAGTP